ncbi:MAG: hypothetical protein FWE27_05345 [Defluviitaleaceae bacterium]|nr:hypothetical protein [Defluviitaleaceae bacterium]
MQINNSTAGLFQHFQQIRNQQGSNFRNLCFSEESERIRRESANRNAYYRCVTVFEDENIRINVFDRNNHEMTPEEIEAWGLLGTVVVICMRTWHTVVFSDADLSDKLYNKFMQMANAGELNCTADDFTNAMSEWLKLLLSKWLDEILFGIFDEQSQTLPDAQITDTPIVDEATNDLVKELLAEFLEKNGLEVTCREFLDNFIDAVQKTNYHSKPNIPILTEEELLRIEPNEHQRIKKGLFYDVSTK